VYTAGRGSAWARRRRRRRACTPVSGAAGRGRRPSGVFAVSHGRALTDRPTDSEAPAAAAAPRAFHYSPDIYPPGYPCLVSLMELRALCSRLKRRCLEFRPLHFQVTTLGKLFADMGQRQRQGCHIYRLICVIPLCHMSSCSSDAIVAVTWKLLYSVCFYLPAPRNSQTTIADICPFPGYG